MSNFDTEGEAMEADDISSEGPPQEDCKFDVDAEGTPLGEDLRVEHVEDSLEVKFKTFCTALRPW